MGIFDLLAHRSCNISKGRVETSFVRVGCIFCKICGLNVNEQIFNKDLLSIYNGALAEQFVGQELLACGSENLYYWARDAKSSSAEVDYLIENNGEIIPLEIKSGAAGRLKSLHLLLKSYPDISHGYVLSQRPYSELPEQKLIFMPLYAALIFGKRE